MYYLIYIFTVFFAFMIYPWGMDPYFTFPKAFYLLGFTIMLWLTFIFNSIKNQRPLFENLKLIDWLLFIFMLLVGISTMSSVNLYLSLFGETLRKEGISALFCYFSLLYLASRIINSERQIFTLTTSMVWSSLIVGIYGILQHFMLDFLPRSIRSMNTTRSFAFFDNPNFYGTYLVIMLILALTLYLIQFRIRNLNIAFGIIALVLFVSVLYSGTRSAWLAIFCGILLLTFTVVIRRKHLWTRWLLILVAFSILFVSINLLEGGSYGARASGILKEAQKITTDESGHAGSSRWYIWKKALPLIPQYFWIGSGPDTFAVVFPINPYELHEHFNSLVIKVDKAHNEYLQMAITFGVPALLIYLCLVSLILYSAWKNNKYLEDKLQILNIGLSIVIISYLIQAFFNISVITVAPFYWICLGLSYYLSTSYKRSMV